MYYLKYYAEIQNFRGQFARVEIHVAATRPQTVLQIGDVCGLDLEIQGSQDDVFTPIVKTQAHLSMISSDDKPTEQGIKYGGWGEFFTPDATLYKMLIKTRATEQDPWTTRWTGYITPDSWQEDLGYRTPVTITARDNIGHLQDFEFDFDNYDQYGLASIRSIITAGMNLIELPMTLDMNSAPANFQADGTSVLDAMVMCRHFEGKDWYSVIESLLDAIGYTLRYTDNNRVTLAPIRYLPNGGRGTGGDNRSNAVPVQFYDGNGVVVPAVKSIIEEHNYDYLGEVEIPIRSSDINYGPEGSYKAYVKWTNTRPGMEGKDAPVYSIVDGGSTNWLPGSDLYKTEDPSLLTLDREGESWDDYIFLAANGKRYSDAEGKRKQALQFTTRTPNVTLRAKFNSNPLSVLQDIVVPEDPEYEEEIKGGFVLENIGLYTFEFKVKYESNGETVYWDDTAGWVTEEVTNTRTFEPSSMTTDVEIQLESASGMEGHGVMTFYFENIQYETSGISSLIVACHGVYARLSSFTIEPNAINLSKNTVKTNSDERYNVILRRNPEVSPLSRDVLFALPGNYETGLFYYPSGSNFPEQYPYSGNWSNLNTSATKPLPVIIHQQILAFRGGVLWELSGECAPIDGGILFANQLVRYKDRVYLITSGTIDFYGSGNLLSAVLREYVDYDDIWDDTEQGDWSGDGEYNTIGGETASGSGHSGSSGGGGGSATNFFELDGAGGVKLKDRYNGLSAKGHITSGGMGSTSEEGGADLQSVWLSLKTNEDEFANEKIHAGHLPIGSGLTINSQGLIDVTVQGGVTSVAGMTGDVSAASLKTALGLGSLAYKSSLQASDIPMITTAKISDIGAAATYGVGSVASGNNGLVTGGAVYAAINSAISSAIKYQGVTTTPLTDGATTNPITIDGASYTAKSGDEVIYGGREYLYTGSKWQQLGDEESWALKTVSITGTGYLTGGGTLEASRTIDIAASVKTKIENGATAYGWGNHANAGYFAASSFTAANIVTTLGTTAVNRATADASGNNIINTYATITALNSVSGRVSTLEGRTNWDNYFGIDASGNIYVKMKDANNARNFYGYGAVTAGGVGSSSGGGGGGGSTDLLEVWSSLQASTGDYGNWKINTSHFPSLNVGAGLSASYSTPSGSGASMSTLLNIGVASGYTLPTTTAFNAKIERSNLWASLQNNDIVSTYDSYKIAVAHIPDLSISKVTGLQTALDGKQATISDLSTIRSNASLGASAYNALPNYLPLSAGSGKPLTGNLYVSNRYIVRTERDSGHGSLFIGDYYGGYDDGIFYVGAGSESPSDNWFRIQSQSSILITADRANLYSDDYTKSLFIDRSGYFSIGTATYSGYKLNVSGTFNASTIYQNGTTLDNTYLALSGGVMTGGNISWSSDSHGIYFYGGCGIEKWSGYGPSLVTEGSSTTFEISVGNSRTTRFTILHSGNYSSYALPLSGGTMSNTNVVTNLNADLLDSYNESSFLRYRGDTFTDGENTLWDQIGIKGYIAALPDGMASVFSGAYTYGEVITLPAASNTCHFELYVNHGSSNWDSLYFRSGWNTGKEAWSKFWTSNNSNLSTVAWACSTLTANSHISAGGNISADGSLDIDGTASFGGQYGCDVYLRRPGTNYISASASGGTIAWRVNGSPSISMFLNSSGYLGLGTDSPDRNFVVSASVTNSVVKVENTYNGGGMRGLEIFFPNTTGTIFPILLGKSPTSYNCCTIAYGYLGNSSTSNYVGIGHYDNDFILNVVGTGRVGIATVSPSNTLEVNGTFYASGNSSIGGTFGVTGATTLSGALTVNNTASISGNTTIGGTLTVTGNTTLNGNFLNVIGDSFFHSDMYLYSGMALFFDAGGNNGIWYSSGDSTIRFGFDDASHFTSGVYSDSFITGGGVNASSDARLKDNLSAVSAEKALSVLMQLRPMEWVWNEKNAYLEGKPGAGLVAQDVESVLPFAVSRDTEYLSLNYNVFHAYEIAGLQNHEERIKALEKENEELKREIELLKQ